MKTRQKILEAATQEFARYGLGGARVDRIATRAGANKRMLYYYFGDKDELFLAVLEESYAQIRGAERELDCTPSNDSAIWFGSAPGATMKSYSSRPWLP